MIRQRSVGVGRSLWIGVLLVILILPAFAAQAKVPPFTVQVIPERPVAGETATIEVVLEAAIGVERLGQLVRFQKTSPDGDGRVLPVDVVLAEPASGFDSSLSAESSPTGRTYRGAVVFPEPGDWVMTAFPSIAQDQLPAGYPGSTEIQVARADPAVDDSLRVALAAAGTVGLSLLAVSRSVRRSNDRSLDRRALPEPPEAATVV